MTSMADAPMWEQKLRSMVEYHTTCLAKGGSYAPYRDSSRSGMLESVKPSAPHTTALSGEAKALLKDHGTQLIDQHNAHVMKVKTKLQTELKDDKSPDKPAWVTKFEDSGKKLKEDSAKAIDAMTAKLIEVTNKLPEKMREPTADGWVSVIDKFTEFWKNTLAAVSVAIDALVNWIKEVWETVKASFEHAAQFLQAATSWVVQQFS